MLKLGLCMKLSATHQYSTPSSTPQPMTDTMWLMVGNSFFCLKTPPVCGAADTPQ